MIRRCAEAGLREPEFEVGAGFLIRTWRSGDHEITQDHRDTTREATGTARSEARSPELDSPSQTSHTEFNSNNVWRPTCTALKTPIR